MKRIIWVSLLLTIGGLLMPLVFMDENSFAFQPPEVSESPAVSEAPEPSPTQTPGQASAVKDSENKFTALIDGEVVLTDMTEFLPRVLAAEMPVTFEEDALRAQAVAARTYIAYCIEHENPKHPEADVCTDANCCMAYKDDTALRGSWGHDYEANMELIKSSVEYTNGRIITYDGQPILASFHSSSAGMTENGGELWGDVPYLTGVVSPETENDVPDFVTGVEVSAGNFRESLLLLRPEAVFGDDPSVWVEGMENDDSGRVRSAAIGGASFTGQELRKLFSLRSTAFTLRYEDGIFIFTVTGYGHGLGMSQYGANVMARKGFTWEEILHHYYTDTVIV